VPFAVKTVGELKVGFFALVSRPWDELQTQPEHLNFYDLDCDFDYAAVARDLVARHRHEVDLLVHLSHLGLRADIDLCEAVDGIDIVLGGHSHHALAEAQTVNGATLIHCGAEGEFVGQLDLEVTRGGVGYSVTKYELKVTAEQEPHPPTDSKILGLVAARAPGWDRPLFAAEHDGTIEAVSQLAAAALLRVPLLTAAGTEGEVAYADAVLLDDALARLRPGGSPRVGWAAGEAVSPQTFVDIFPIEIQLPGTEGTTAFFCVELSAHGARNLLEAVMHHGSTRDGNCLAEYFAYLNAGGEFGTLVPPRRKWRFAIQDPQRSEDDDAVICVHQQSIDEDKERAHNIVGALEAVAAGASRGIRVLMPKPAALHPAACGLPEADRLDMLGAPTFVMEVFEALVGYSERQATPVDSVLAAALPARL